MRHVLSFWLALYVTAYDSSLGVADEFDDFIAFACGGYLGLDAVDCVGNVESREIEVAVNLLDCHNLLACEVATAQTYGVYTRIGDGITSGFHERWDIFVDACATLNHYVCAKMTELVDERTTTDYGEIVYLHLAGNLCGIGDNHVVTYRAIMRHVGISHYQAVATHFGEPFRSCAAVYCDAFAKGGVVADNCHGFLAFEFQILRNSGDYGARENVAVFSDARALHYGHITADMSSFTDFDILVDGHEGLYHYARMDFGCGVDICKRLFHCKVKLLVFNDLGHKLAFAHNLVAYEGDTLHQSASAAQRCEE